MHEHELIAKLTALKVTVSDQMDDVREYAWEKEKQMCGAIDHLIYEVDAQIKLMDEHYDLEEKKHSEVA